MDPRTLDHVALWVADRDAIADFACSHLGMHVIDRTEAFTLLGADARRGKLTLFAAEGPRERGALAHVAFRVSNVAAAGDGLPDDRDVARPRSGELYVDVAEGLRVGLIEAPGDADYDFDHVALLARAPEEAAREYVRLGFRPAPAGASGAPRVEVGGAYVELHEGDPGTVQRPLLNHLAVLVESAEQHRDEAEELGFEVADFVDAPNTLAVFVWGPERVKVEYVEHKPTFSLV